LLYPGLGLFQLESRKGFPGPIGLSVVGVQGCETLLGVPKQWIKIQQFVFHRLLICIFIGRKI